MTPIVEELTPAPDPERCCEHFAGLPFRLFLDSASRDPRLGRYSFLGADPALIIRSKGAVTERIDRDGVRTTLPTDALTSARALLAPYQVGAVPGLPPFQGGAAGYIAYDWGLTLERLPAPRYDDLALDEVVLGIYDCIVAWDHSNGKAWIISTGIPETDPQERARVARLRAAAVRERLRVGPATTRAQGAVASGGNESTSASRAAASAPTTAGSASAPSHLVDGGWWDPKLAIRSSFTRLDYLAAVQRVRDYIYAGDIFQTNLSQRFDAPLTEEPWALYQRLRRRNAAPFAAYMEVPDAAILSASPERFLRIDPGGYVETRPIKGTRPRGLGPEHDAALGHALTESEKDRAENLMIVDLMRNDLSRVCAPGTVRVPELFALERYATVHHLVSTVVGQLAPGTDALDLVRAAFPGGSITGAPKLRAMEIIAELEPSHRGVYCGSMGYWSVTGDLDTSIAIRTAVARGGRVYFSAGGGIVADSVPEQEYRETLDKARGIIDALAIPI